MTQSDAIAQLPQQGKSLSNGTHTEYLTVQDIASACNVSYKTVRQYADLQSVKTWMGAYSHPASKGVRWPPECEARWRTLLDAAAKKLLTPATTDAWLANAQISQAIAQSPEPGNLMPIQSIAQLPDLGNEAIALLRQLVHQQPPPDDCLLDAEGAAHLLCCSPRSVRRYVAPVRRGRWKRSDVLAYIASL